MLFCFCEAFSRNNKSVAVVSFITQKWFSYRPGMNYGCYEYIIFRDIYLHNLNGVAEKRQHPNSTEDLR